MGSSAFPARLHSATFFLSKAMSHSCQEQVLVRGCTTRAPPALGVRDVYSPPCTQVPGLGISSLERPLLLPPGTCLLHDASNTLLVLA